MSPYYEHAGITIYHGDCRSVLSNWDCQHGVKSFDLLLTDPPYGIKQGRTRCGHGAKVRKSGFDVGRTLADCELAWTSFDKAVRKLTYRWNGMLQQPGRPKERRIHPAQKPEAVLLWALGLAPASTVSVLDPFMGSGTALVAAKRLNKQAVGIEQSERYCEIAAERLSQEALPLALDSSPLRP